MSDLIFICKNEAELDNIALNLLKLFSEKKIFCFYGNLGVGKTTLIKAFCKNIGVVDAVTSPTFSIINEYKNSKNETVYHFDFYRIKNIEEAYDIGYEEYFYSNNYCFIEWPEKINGFIPKDAVKVKLEVTENEKRIITIQN